MIAAVFDATAPFVSAVIAAARSETSDVIADAFASIASSASCSTTFSVALSLNVSPSNTPRFTEPAATPDSVTRSPVLEITPDRSVAAPLVSKDVSSACNADLIVEESAMVLPLKEPMSAESFATPVKVATLSTWVSLASIMLIRLPTTSFESPMTSEISLRVFSASGAPLISSLICVLTNASVAYAFRKFATVIFFESKSTPPLVVSATYRKLSAAVEVVAVRSLTLIEAIIIQ